MNGTFRFPETTFYRDRFGLYPPCIADDPHPSLRYIVVIPCYRETLLVKALAALKACSAPRCALEIIVVVNSGESATADDLAQNLQTIEESSRWARETDTQAFRTHILHFPDLPRRASGVGLARKIGMDEAVYRFDRAGCADGIIICFDADCTCDPNYLVEVERYFEQSSASPGCSIYFEHPLTGPEPPEIYEAITLYELHLRYYVAALRYAAFPHAFHTIGSSMAVRARDYLKQGGMNKRKAGEDFYFLQKIIPLGEFGEINSTRVIPSPRISDRVPFGTGKAVGEYLLARTFTTYPLQAFLDLRTLFHQANLLFEKVPDSLTESLTEFLTANQFDAALNEIRANSSSSQTCANRFFRWFDGFRVMKYIHYARDYSYGTMDVAKAATDLLSLEQHPAPKANPRNLLETYRGWQRSKKGVAKVSLRYPQERKAVAPS